LKLFCVDPWQAYQSGHIEHADQATVNQFYAQAVQRLQPYNCAIIRKSSLEAVKKFEDGLLDFVFVDGDHSYEATMEDIIHWSRKLRKGGIMSGHDYYNRPPDQYLRSGPAVRAYCQLTGMAPWFTFGRRLSHPDKHELKDGCRSFMWVKP
jgi:predicted O-methyltransferase YrrM